MELPSKIEQEQKLAASSGTILERAGKNTIQFQQRKNKQENEKKMVSLKRDSDDQTNTVIESDSVLNETTRSS